MIEGIADMLLLQPLPQTIPDLPSADLGAPEDAVRDPSSGELRLGDVLFIDPARLDAMGDEVDLVALATDDYGGPIIITGWWTGYGSGGGGGGGYDGWDSNENDYSQGDGTPEPTPPDLNCLSAIEIDALSAQEREAYEVAVEAAEIAREIMLKPDKDLLEYGSIIYRDANGIITHTPVTSGGLTYANLSTQGMLHYGQIVAIVHSHTALTFNSTYPDYKLYPTPDNGNKGQGDWYTYDWNYVEIV